MADCLPGLHHASACGDVFACIQIAVVDREALRSHLNAQPVPLLEDHAQRPVVDVIALRPTGVSRIAESLEAFAGLAAHRPERAATLWERRRYRARRLTYLCRRISENRTIER